MEKIINVKQIIVNIHNDKVIQEEPVDDSEKMSLLVETLRIIAGDEYFNNTTVLIPDKCKKYGFAKGQHKLDKLLYFLADMLEE